MGAGSLMIGFYNNKSLPPMEKRKRLRLRNPPIGLSGKLFS